VQFVWVSDGQLELTLPAGTMKAAAALIPAHLPHAFAAPGSPLALLLVDAHGSRGAALHRRARELSGRDVVTLLRNVAFPRPQSSVAEAEVWIRTILSALGVDSVDTRAPSRTTRRAVAYIEHALDGVPRVTDAAAHASTSATRLSHLFSREIGIPFRRFVLWTRLKRAVEVTRDGGDLTAAAAAAGFSDAAHLSRTFRAMFGLSPSTVLPFIEISGQPWTGTPPLAPGVRIE